MTLAVVTGGGRGIGAAICRALAADGYDVLLTYQSDAVAAERVAADCRTTGVVAQTIRADVGEPSDVAATFVAADEMGGLTALVNNAGIIDESARVEDMTAERIRRMFDVNVTGLLLACGHAVRRMTDGGVIVNISSRAAQRGGAGMYVDYAASKAAVETITAGLAQEVAPAIRVNAVSPGLIDTGIHHDQRDGALAERARSVPLGRPGTPDEVAAAVRWLVSPKSSYVTGTVLRVSGGR
ncbi:MAG: SDR family oxidoreductase [Mycobacteriales bacterium]